MAKIRDWKLLSSHLDGDYGIFRVRTERALSPRTKMAGEFYTLDCGSWVNVVPITAAGEVVMIRQYRHGTHRVHLEIPGGLVDEADPRDAAIRELAEETGYEGSPVTFLGSVSPNPALFNNRCYTYLVENVRKTRVVSLDPNEDIEVRLFPLLSVPSLITEGRIDHALVVVAFHLYFQRYGSPVARPSP
jgi:ADP-ribose pyrophosphatase